MTDLATKHGADKASDDAAPDLELDEIAEETDAVSGGESTDEVLEAEVVEGQDEPVDEVIADEDDLVDAEIIDDQDEPADAPAAEDAAETVADEDAEFVEEQDAPADTDLVEEEAAPADIFEEEAAPADLVEEQDAPIDSAEEDEPLVSDSPAEISGEAADADVVAIAIENAETAESVQDAVEADIAEDELAAEDAVADAEVVAIAVENAETAESVQDAVEADAPTALHTIETEAPATDPHEHATAATATLIAAPAAAQVDAGQPGGTTYAWAPAEPAPKKRRTGLWIGLAAGVAVVGLVAASLVLIAPGTSVGGVGVGGLTEGAATDALEQRLAETTIVLTGEGGDVELTGADLGASIDAAGLASTAFAEHPMWNVTQWFTEPIDAIVHLDDVEATEVLRDAAPSLYTDPVDATLEFDAATVSYVTTPGELGTGVDVGAVRQALQAAFAEGRPRVEFEPVAAPVQPETPAFVAESTAAGLNRIITGAGFYLDGVRVVPVAPEVAASWITVEPGDRGTFDVSIDEAAIQPVVDSIAAVVNIAPVNNAVITNSAGAVLREESNGTAGRAVDDTSGFADDYATQLADFDPVFNLPMTEVPFTTVTLARRVEVNLSNQRAYFYENDQLVRDIIMSSGVSGSATPSGRFTVNGYSRVQSMGCFEGAPYCVRDVPWVTWFAPDVGFHGASSLRSSLGFRQSHGCVNMWDSDAKWVYDWTARGTEVWVHS